MKHILLTILILGGLMANSLPKHYSKKLKNGLEVVVVPLKNGSGVISTDIFYKVGSRNERMGLSGMAHMLEHLNFKSTKELKAGEFDKIVKGFGGVNNASTGFDYTHYFIKSSAKNLDKSMGLFAEMMQNLRLLDKEFQPERDVVMEERKWRTDNNPMGYLYFRLFNNSYIYHPYHWTPIGFVEDIKNWSIKDIRKFHDTYYQPQNALLLITGDIDPELVFKKAEKNFADINSSGKIPKVHTIEPVQDGAKRIEIFKQSEVQMLAMAYHIPNFQHPDQVALSALSEILSSGKSSRLYSQLVDKKRLVNTIYAYNIENIDPSIFMFMAICNPDVNATDVEKEILSEIENIKNQGISKEELDRVKINVRSDFVFGLESSSSVANLFGSYLVRGDLTPLEKFEENLEKLTSKDIIEVAKKYLIAKNSTTVILKKEK